MLHAGITLEGRRELFLVLLEDQRGNVSAACEAAGVSRQTYYRWLEDEHFAEACSIVREGLIDWVEGKLFELVEDGSSRDTQFYLRTQAKHRGYGEGARLEIGIPSGTSDVPQGVGYPPEPGTVEEWERQVESARKSRNVVEEPQPKEEVPPRLPVALLPAPAPDPAEDESEQGDTPP